MDPLVIGAVGTLIGAVFTGLGVFIVNLKKQAQSENIENNNQAIEVYRGIAESLKKDSIMMASDLTKLNEDRLTCREKCSAMVVTIQYLQEENKRLSEKLLKYESVK